MDFMVKFCPNWPMEMSAFCNFVSRLPPSGSSLPKAGSSATVTGFGTTSADSDAPSSHLLTVNVNILTNSECRAKNPIYSGKVDSNMICAGVGQGGKDACKRDSGGPLVAELGGRANLVGVVSWGYGCAAVSTSKKVSRSLFVFFREGMFGVYVEVAKLRNWIDEKISENGGATFCSS